MLTVNILPKKLEVGVKGQPKIIEGELHKKIKAGDSFWTIEKDGVKRTLQINLQKSDNMSWWDSIIEGDPKIDT